MTNMQEFYDSIQPNRSGVKVCPGNCYDYSVVKITRHAHRWSHPCVSPNGAVIHKGGGFTPRRAD